MRPSAAWVTVLIGKMNRIFKKAALRISLLFSVVIAAAIVFSGFYLDNAYKNEKRGRLLQNARIAAHAMASAGDDYADVLTRIDQTEDLRITMIAYDGRVIFDTRADAETLENHGGRPEVKRALESGSGADVRFSSTLGKDMMYVALRDDSLKSVIRISLMLEGVAAYSAGLWIPLVILLGAAFLLCLGIALFVSRSMTQPIMRLRDNMARIAKGHYDGLEKIKTGDEVETLSEALIDMAQTLKQNFDAITENSSRLEAVFRAVPGGIVAVDQSMHVIMANPAARRMFDMDETPDEKHFLEVTRHTQIESVIKEAAASEGVVEREITLLRGREEVVLRLFAVKVHSEAKGYGVIVLVQDMTRMRRLETLRSDFAANVSHELKTPLTVIRGFTDTLKDDAISHEDARRFIDIISIESERLSRLIDDILLLSDIENAPAGSQSVADLRIGVQEAIQLLKIKADEKSINLHVSISDQAVWTGVEKDRVKQMAINLIDNAIKYTPSGGSVFVAVYTQGAKGVLRVEDTGIGIPKENIPRLFERFYRVDKSRSRALGGTGLGLAIVKHIVNLVDGRISVKSSPGEGSIFTVFLPLSRIVSQDAVQ